MNLSEPMKKAILTIGDLLWRDTIPPATLNAISRRALVLRRYTPDRDDIIGLTKQGMEQYWKLSQQRDKEE